MTDGKYADSPRFPFGLANASGLFDNYLMPNSQSSTQAVVVEPHSESESVQVTLIAHGC